MWITITELGSIVKTCTSLKTTFTIHLYDIAPVWYRTSLVLQNCDITLVRYHTSVISHWCDSAQAWYHSGMMSHMCESTLVKDFLPWLNYTSVMHIAFASEYVWRHNINVSSLLCVIFYFSCKRSWRKRRNKDKEANERPFSNLM